MPICRATNPPSPHQPAPNRLRRLQLVGYTVVLDSCSLLPSMDADSGSPLADLAFDLKDGSRRRAIKPMRA
jgi:hypothetical protein